MKPSHLYIITKYILFPIGFTLLFFGYFVLFNLKSCSGESLAYRNSIAEADENFIEGTVDAKGSLVKTKYSGTLTVAFLEEEDTLEMKNILLFPYKVKNKIKSLRSNIVPFLLVSKNSYIYYGFYGKEFSIDHEFDFVYENEMYIQTEKHIYNHDYISIFTEKGNVRQPDGITTPFILFRGSRQKWIQILDEKISNFEKKYTLCYFFMSLGGLLILLSVYIRKKMVH